MDRNTGALLDLNPLNALASHRSDNLEHRATRVDPFHVLREHLDAHPRDRSSLPYAEWVEEALMALEDGWDRESAVTDGTFYEEGGAHRNLWNKPTQAGENVVAGRKRGH